MYAKVKTSPVVAFQMNQMQKIRFRRVGATSISSRTSSRYGHYHEMNARVRISTCINKTPQMELVNSLLPMYGSYKQNNEHLRIKRIEHVQNSKKNTILKMSIHTDATESTCSNSPSLTTLEASSPILSNERQRKIVILSEAKWRSDSELHSKRIHDLLQPGLTSMDDQINSGLRRQRRNRKQKRQQKSMMPILKNESSNDGFHLHDQGHHQESNKEIIWTALDGKNPIFNFLIEYYGLKGAKGPKRLGRWSPDPELLVKNENDDDGNSNDHTYYHQTSCKEEILVNYISHDDDDDKKINTDIIEAIMNCTQGQGGIFLENANGGDLNGVLNLRGAIPITTVSKFTEAMPTTNELQINDVKLHGMLYNPYLFYSNKSTLQTSSNFDSTSNINQQSQQTKQSQSQQTQLQKTIAPFQWYKCILQTTLHSEPIFHCHGLHEWAMLYHPPNAPPPPSAKYQKHLPIRVSRQVINDTVERRGISCTHVDALRFFAPAAGPLNHHGSSLERMDQLKLEQKGCVHAHMDLLKIALKLQPFISGKLVCDVLEVSIAARKLDVEASPYDVRGYGGGVVAVETEEGRRVYRMRQRELMKTAEPVRVRLLHAYDVFLSLAFDDSLVLGSTVHVDDGTSDHSAKDVKIDYGEDKKVGSYAAPERFARAEPGGLPWRKNLIQK